MSEVIVYEIRANSKSEGENIKKLLNEYEGISVENATISTETRTCLNLPALITSQRIIEGHYLWLWLTFFNKRFSNTLAASL